MLPCPPSREVRDQRQVYENVWLRGVDLNHRPLGYEFCEKRSFNELAGVVVRTKEWKRA
jgi:hypothetical protein